MAPSTRKTPTTLTVDEIVLDVIDILGDDQLNQLKHGDLPGLAYHHSLGGFIRNRYIHSGEFTIDTEGELTLLHPDDFSALLVRRVLSRIRGSS